MLIAWIFLDNNPYHRLLVAGLQDDPSHIRTELMNITIYRWTTAKYNKI